MTDRYPRSVILKPHMHGSRGSHIKSYMQRGSKGSCSDRRINVVNSPSLSCSSSSQDSCIDEAEAPLERTNNCRGTMQIL